MLPIATAPALAPRAASAFTFKMPSLIVTPPVKVFAAVSAMVPAPDLVSAPAASPKSPDWLRRIVETVRSVFASPVALDTLKTVFGPRWLALPLVVAMVEAATATPTVPRNW